MEVLEKKCPGCRSMKITEYKTYMTQNHGSRQLYHCEECGKVFSETKNTILEGLKTPLSQVWHVLEARSEGMGQRPRRGSPQAGLTLSPEPDDSAAWAAVDPWGLD